MYETAKSSVTGKNELDCGIMDPMKISGRLESLDVLRGFDMFFIMV